MIVEWILETTGDKCGAGFQCDRFKRKPRWYQHLFILIEVTHRHTLETVYQLITRRDRAHNAVIRTGIVAQAIMASWSLSACSVLRFEMPCVRWLQSIVTFSVPCWRVPPVRCPLQCWTGRPKATAYPLVELLLPEHLC